MPESNMRNIKITDGDKTEKALLDRTIDVESGKPKKP